jgi:hypothetical protein
MENKIDETNKRFPEYENYLYVGGWFILEA